VILSKQRLLKCITNHSVFFDIKQNILCHNKIDLINDKGKSDTFNGYIFVSSRNHQNSYVILLINLLLRLNKQISKLKYT